jgi:hypothetical protein
MTVECIVRKRSSYQPRDTLTRVWPVCIPVTNR